MAAGRIVLPPYFPARDRNGRLASGALLYCYANGTTTLSSIFADADMLVPLANPIAANSSGQFPSVWAEAGDEAVPVLYSLAVTKADGSSIGNPSVFDDYRPSVDYDTAALSLAEGYALTAEYWAGIAQAAVAPLTGSGLTFEFEGDGTTTRFQMAEEVEAGAEFAVEVILAGAPQLGSFFCDGTDYLEFYEAPADGAEGLGQHVARGIAVSFDPPPFRTVAGGPLLTLAHRLSRTPDVEDCPDIYMDGSTDDGPGLEAALVADPILTHTTGVLRITTNTVLSGGLSVTGGQFYIGTGITLDLTDVTFAAPDNVFIFTGPGEVIGLRYATVEWFGGAADYDEAETDGGDCTDNSPAMNKAFRASTRVKGLRGAYGLESPVQMIPWQRHSQHLEGEGDSSDAGTRYYSKGGASGGQIWVRGTFAAGDVGGICEYSIRNLGIFPSDDANPQLLLIAGDGGATDKRLTGLKSSIIENVTLQEGEQMITIKSVDQLRLRNVSAISTVNPGTSVYIGLTTGANQTVSLNFEGCRFAQPQTGDGGGYAVQIINSETGASSPNQAEIRGISFDDACEIYGGKNGIDFYLYCEADPAVYESKVRTIGDFYFSGGTKAQGDGSTGAITSNKALLVEARNGARISQLEFYASQIEGFDEDAIDVRATTTGGLGVYGNVAVVKIIGTTIRYCKNRSVYMDRVRGAYVMDVTQEYCGAAASATVDHVYLLNCMASRVENVITSSEDASWPGLANGLRVTGGSTVNVRSRNNAMGTSGPGFVYDSSYTNSGDSADQPSLPAQV